MLSAINRISNFEFRISGIHVVLFSIITFVLMLFATPVFAQACAGAPTQYPTACQPSCGVGYALAANYYNIDQKLATASCGSNQCCLQLGSAACDAEAKANGNQSGSCKSSCASGESPSRQPSSTCGSGQKCCYANGSAPTGSGCIKLQGVTSACKTAADADEISAAASTYWSTNNLNGACPNLICAIKTGNALCAAVAKQDKLQGAYSCVKASDGCASPALSQSNGLVGGFVCGPGATCCIPKAGAATVGGPTAPVTLPDPLSGANLPQLIGNVIRTFAGIAGALALLMFVYGGLMWILSGGEGGKVAKAQQILRNATIGLILIFGAYFFTSAIVQGILANPK
jgi:hypothetical protein